MSAKPIKLVWVIDDDPLQVLVLNRLLTTNQGVQSTKFFSGGKSAIDALSANKGSEKDTPDLIFLDLVMTHGDGWDFLDYYKKNKLKFARKARIIVISSSSEETSKRLKQYPDVHSFLGKPIDIKEFNALLNDLFEKEVAS